MDKKMVENIRKNMEAKTTEELQQIWKENNRNEYSDEAFEAIRQLLSEREKTSPPPLRLGLSLGDRKDRRSAMGFSDDLRNAKVEWEQQRLRAQQEDNRRRSHGGALLRAISDQRRNLFQSFDQIVIPLLTAVADETWGPDAYTVIRPDGLNSISWYAVRAQGHQTFNYAVTLKATQKDTGDLSLAPSDKLVQPCSLLVSAAGEFPAEASETGLQNALTAAFKSGPRNHGLDEHAQRALATSPYKRGERDGIHWGLVALACISLIVGLILRMGNEVLWGILVVTGTAASLAVTHMGHRFRRLPVGLGNLLQLLAFFPAWPECSSRPYTFCSSFSLLWLFGSSFG